MNTTYRNRLGETMSSVNNNPVISKIILREAEAAQVLETLMKKAESYNKEITRLQTAHRYSRTNTYANAYALLAEMADLLSMYGDYIVDNPPATAQVVTAAVIDGCSVLKMPLPKVRSDRQNRYALRSDLRTSLGQNIIPYIPTDFHLADICTLTFAFAPHPGVCRYRAIDHDNYYVKPIIDTICAAHGIDDSGADLNLCHYLIPDNPQLSPWLYAILSPSRNAPSYAKVIQLCSSPELQKNQREVDNN